MIPSRKLKAISVPNWTQREYKTKASEGYCWAHHTIEGIELKVVVPPDWVQVDYPQEKDKQGFTSFRGRRPQSDKISNVYKLL